MQHSRVACSQEACGGCWTRDCTADASPNNSKRRAPLTCNQQLHEQRGWRDDTYSAELSAI